MVYPDNVVDIKLKSTWRGLPFATVEIKPVRYNPANRELFVARRLVVRVNHHGSFRKHYIEPRVLPVLKTLVDNPGRFALDVDWFDDPGVRYLVIAHSNYVGGWLDSLVNWHQKRGIQTRVIANSFWTDVEIKDSIRAEYNRNNPATLRSEFFLAVNITRCRAMFIPVLVFLICGMLTWSQLMAMTILNWESVGSVRQMLLIWGIRF